ncbi:sensor histidine kinase [Nostocoides sp. HKS02]|uniref:sensor histidine kinase n=1 Tax=Nostocoides sp. HKS02 TaxID=1813880 RepID=UPI0018A808A9|nr:sensor histidine kinase [Tetrasphaera sp. HKS02]
MTFYDDDLEAVDGIVSFLLEGLLRDEGVVVVATADHRAAVDEALLRLGADPGRAKLAGRYLSVDAAETLAAFMVHGAPHPEKFAASVGGLITDAAKDGGQVRVFGEMVALLWADHQVTAALELESLWNSLADHHEFSLLCAYPTSALNEAGLSEVSQVCDLHSRLLPPTRYDSAPRRDSGAAGWQRTEVFVPVPEAVGAVRRLVTQALEEWGEDLIVYDAALAISEMATNAVTHARSPFRVFLHRSPEVVIVAVKDARVGSPSRPHRRQPGPERTRADDRRSRRRSLGLRHPGERQGRLGGVRGVPGAGFPRPHLAVGAAQNVAVAQNTP